VVLCVCRLPEGGAQVPKHVGLPLIMNGVLCCVFHCVLSSAFVCRNTGLCIHKSGPRVLFIIFGKTIQMRMCFHLPRICKFLSPVNS